MKNAVIIHGICDEDEYFSDKYPSLSNSHWLPWLQKQLLMKNILTQTPEMPEAYKPEYDKWVKEFERYEVNKDTVLIGHSCGGGFLLRWLSENKIKINKLVLVAPWLDPKREKTTSFFDFEIDKDIKERTAEIHLLVSKDDKENILKSVEIIKKSLPNVLCHEFLTSGHFCFSDIKTDKFPELLSLITS
ncbi:hypothetical protein COX21_01515 [Candidatus Falkowbacteria bacterium CG23_combo_of_CG06-09_8_20_14_all_41_10]|uniref:Alpha/beta hydrolase n=1 Tax=Candidatus Falkowbacteria bacterium CG23_combo_of_CG06-09_8_20_14_all_41_10 TaxID=1974571 RepID=A0A2G9ZNE0_9BACT|nr:MAG: hypothetical protein COX21_01515 [Candidatus Falkowbacteria bacterium CG23_combo_of_CG06-09_8_20_14_all_41_10]